MEEGETSIGKLEDIKNNLIERQSKYKKTNVAHEEWHNDCLVLKRHQDMIEQERVSRGITKHAPPVAEEQLIRRTALSSLRALFRGRGGATVAPVIVKP